MFKGLVAISFGLFWLAFGWFVQANGGPDMVMRGIYAIGMLALVVGILQLSLGVMAAGNRARTASGGWRDDGEPTKANNPGFDPDAAIERYKAQKAAEASTPLKPALPPQPSGFGRKN